MMTLGLEEVTVRSWKTLIIKIIDMFMVNMAYLFSINITKSESFTEIAKIYTHDCIALSLIYLVCFYLFKMYESLWHLTGTDEFLLGVGGSVLAGILSIGYTRFFGSVIPLNVSVVGILLSIFFVLGYRILYMIYKFKFMNLAN